MKRILEKNIIQFIVADIGNEFEWININESSNFWKSIRNNVVENSEEIYLENFANEYCFIASKWKNKTEITLIYWKKFTKSTAYNMVLAKCGVENKVGKSVTFRRRYFSIPLIFCKFVSWKKYRLRLVEN